MKPITILGAVLLAVAVILSAIAGTFHDDYFYHHAYTHNDAYTYVGEDTVWLLTENYQAYLDDHAELSLLFSADQAAHLFDVKGLYLIAKRLTHYALMILIVLFGWLVLQEKRITYFSQTMRATSTILFIVLGIFLILGLSWEWFFTKFHELFFTGNWTFATGALMMRLWGGDFFLRAGIYVLLKILLCTLLLWATGILLEKEKLTWPR